MFYTENVTRSMNRGKAYTFLVIGTLVLLGVIGSIIDCSKIGNNPAFKQDLQASLVEAQYEPISVQKKLPWTHFFLCFALSRNLNKLNIQPYTQTLTERKNKDTPA